MIVSHWGWLSLTDNKSAIDKVLQIWLTISGLFEFSRSTIKCPVSFIFVGDWHFELDLDWIELEIGLEIELEFDIDCDIEVCDVADEWLAILALENSRSFWKIPVVRWRLIGVWVILGETFWIFLLQVSSI